MKFGKHLEANMRPEWRAHYIDYDSLKRLIKEAADEAAADGGPAPGTSWRTTSLSVRPFSSSRDTAEERFFRALEAEVSKVGRFVGDTMAGLQRRLKALRERAAAAAPVAVVVDAGGGAPGGSAPPPAAVVASAERDALLAEAKAVGDELLALEKLVNLNYMGFHKVLKKHDKNLPATPCRQFYTSHLHAQPWVRGNYSEVMVQLSAVFSQLRGDTLGRAAGGAAQAFRRSTTKYWVRTEDVTAVKRVILENMPVFVFNESNYTGDAQLVNSVYLDNDALELYHGRLDKRPGALALRLRWYGPADPRAHRLPVFVERKTHAESWKGDASVKERFTLPEDRVVPFLEGDYGVAEYAAALRARGKPEDDVAAAAALFAEVQAAVDAKQLKPLLRTQYMRSAFQMGHDRTVSFTLDTNLVMLRENPEGAPSCALSGRWYRDPSAPVHRSEVTRFPHAVLEVKLALAEGAAPPGWVAELVASPLVTEVHKMSKFIHGCAVLFPEMVQAVPYWIDDESVRDSILASAPEPPPAAPARAAGGGGGGSSLTTPLLARTESLALAGAKPRRRAPGAHHPLLGDEPTLALMGGAAGGTAAAAGGGGAAAERGGDASLLRLLWPLGRRPRRGPAATIPQRLEPKTFLASERTFLAWLHMAVTVAAISSALLAYAATSERSRDPMHALSRNLVEIIALVLLPLAAAIVGYALLVFVWRSSQISLKRAAYIDDRRGPLLLATLVVAALGGIFVVSLVDLLENGGVPRPPPPGKGAPPPPPAPAPPLPPAGGEEGLHAWAASGGGGGGGAAAAAPPGGWAHPALLVQAYPVEALAAVARAVARLAARGGGSER